jgi:hypothetical protein
MDRYDWNGCCQCHCLKKLSLCRLKSERLCYDSTDKLLVFVVFGLKLILIAAERCGAITHPCWCLKSEVVKATRKKDGCLLGCSTESSRYLPTFQRSLSSRLHDTTFEETTRFFLMSSIRKIDGYHVMLGFFRLIHVLPLIWEIKFYMSTEQQIEL